MDERRIRISREQGDEGDAKRMNKSGDRRWGRNYFISRAVVMPCHPKFIPLLEYRYRDVDIFIPPKPGRMKFFEQVARTNISR